MSVIDRVLVQVGDQVPDWLCSLKNCFGTFMTDCEIRRVVDAENYTFVVRPLRPVKTVMVFFVPYKREDRMEVKGLERGVLWINDPLECQP